MTDPLSILRFRAPYPDDGRTVERITALVEAATPAMHPAVGAWCRREIDIIRGINAMRETGSGPGLCADDIIDRIIATIVANGGVFFRDGDWYVGEPEPQVDRPNVIDTMRAEIDALRASVVASDVRMLSSDIDGLSRRVEYLATQINEISKVRGLDYRLNLYEDAEYEADETWIGEINVIIADPHGLPSWDKLGELPGTVLTTTFGPFYTSRAIKTGERAYNVYGRFVTDNDAPVADPTADNPA